MKRLAFLLTASLLQAQTYDLLIKGGHVIDPANRIDGVMDVAISGARIAQVAADIPAAQGRKIVDATGLYVTPGLIDLHAHVFGYDGSLFPDDTSLIAGTTTVVDAGGSGWRTFDEFRKTVMAHSRTRVLAFINIVGHGMHPEFESDPSDMEPDKTAAKIAQNRDVIVGIKTAHFGGVGWTAIRNAVEAGRLSNTPVMVDDRILTGSGRTSREKLLDQLRPGDMHTHTFNDRQLELIDRFTGKVQPYVLEARKRGVLFDMGHGAGSFLWTVASKAMAQGFMPDTISTDLHSTSILIPQPDMPNCISKMMLLGMSLQDAILRSTVNPAKSIHRFPELGTLNAGAVADVAVFALREGVFAFKDSWHAKRLGTRRLECVLTVRDGKLVYDGGAGDSPAQTSQQGPGHEIWDLLLKNGHVLDPANKRDGRFDVAIIGTKIARVGRDLPASHARTVVEASQYYVTPGLIDIRTNFTSMIPDAQTLPSGVTTAVDAGSSDAKTFEQYKKAVIDRSRTRLLSYSQIIVGLKMADSSAVKDLRAGDIATHVYSGKAASPDALAEARRRGVLFDVGHGSAGFLFRVAAPMIRQGFLPDTISSDIDKDSVMLPHATMIDTMSKLLNIGMTMEQVIERSTVNPARAIHRAELGTLSEGAMADIAVIEQRAGKFGFLDSGLERLVGDKKLACVMTVRNGQVVWDSEALTMPDASRAGPYSNFK